MAVEGGGRTLGYVLSGSTTRFLRFIVAEGMEDHVREGMYVAIHDGPRRILAVVSALNYYHEFYDERDVWAEAVKRGHRPPLGVGRSFLLGEAVIVVEISNQAMGPPRRPPRPGSEVRHVSGRDLKAIFGHDPEDPDVPEHLLPIGRLFGYHNLQALLDLRAVTMHIGVIGTTGSGKTNTVSVIIESLGNKKGVNAGIARLERTIPAIIMDLNADYVYLYKNPELVPQYHKVIRLAAPVSRAYREAMAEGAIGGEVRPLTLDLDALSPHELAEAVASFYKGGPSEGSMLMINLLTTVFEELVARDKLYSRNIVFSNRNVFNRVIDYIRNNYTNKPYHKATVNAAERALLEFFNAVSKYKLVSSRPTITPEFIDTITDPSKPHLVIFDLSVDGLPGPMNVKQFIVYFVAQLLFNKFVEYRSNAEGDSGERVALLVIEEAQNFAPNQQTYKLGYTVAKSLLSTIATQGRKFGLSLVLVTQRPVYVDPVVMSMMNTFIIHRIAPFDLRFVESITGGLPAGFRQNLVTMERGTAIIVGQMNPSPQPLIANIWPRGGHRGGR